MYRREWELNRNSLAKAFIFEASFNHIWTSKTVEVGRDVEQETHRENEKRNERAADDQQHLRLRITFIHVQNQVNILILRVCYLALSLLERHTHMQRKKERN